MRVIVAITNRGALLSGEDTRGNTVGIDFDPEDLTPDDRELIAVRLFDDQFVCQAAVEEDGGTVPSTRYGQPELLVVDGDQLSDLIDAIEADQKEVEAYLASLKSKEKDADAA